METVTWRNILKCKKNNTTGYFVVVVFFPFRLSVLKVVMQISWKFTYSLWRAEGEMRGLIPRSSSNKAI